MTRRRPHADSFATKLSDLSLRQQADAEAVLSVLRRTRRFSCFEASENMKIAGTITALLQSKRLTTVDLGYPWTGIVAIDGVDL